VAAVSAAFDPRERDVPTPTARLARSIPESRAESGKAARNGRKFGFNRNTQQRMFGAAQVQNWDRLALDTYPWIMAVFGHFHEAQRQFLLTKVKPELKGYA
jgi:hypothetical protein